MKIPKPVMERRRSVRLAEKLPFKIGRQDYEAQAVTLNISAHGVLCLLDKEFPLMTQFKLALTLPGSRGAGKGKVISMKGVVVRKDKDSLSGQFLHAIYFSDIKPADRLSLEKYIESRLPADE